MTKILLTEDCAVKLLEDEVSNINLRRHCRAVGKSLRALYKYYVGDNRDVGKLGENEWEIVGILHDSDWEKTTNDPSNHTKLLLTWLQEYEAQEELLNVFKSHNNKITYMRDPETLLEWSLECVDELTGFIVAVALIRPTKKLKDVEVENVLKKFKQKEFAKAVSREQIALCEQKLKIDLNTFVTITLNSMKANSNLLGL